MAVFKNLRREKIIETWAEWISSKKQSFVIEVVDQSRFQPNPTQPVLRLTASCTDIMDEFHVLMKTNILL